MARRNRVPAHAALFAALILTLDAVAQTPPTPQPPPPPPRNPGDFLEAFNQTAATVKLEFIPGGSSRHPNARPHTMACINPDAAVRWPLDSTPPRGTLRMQVMSGNSCEKEQPVCRSELPRDPGMNFVALRGGAGSCAVVAVRPPKGGPLAAAADQPCGPSGAWVPLTIENRYDEPIWVTLYKHKRAMDLPEYAVAACWKPYEKRVACVEPALFTARMEQIFGQADHCSGKPYCDTQHPSNRGFHHPTRVDLRKTAGGGLATHHREPCRWR